jgi:hypothetical protein
LHGEFDLACVRQDHLRTALGANAAHTNTNEHANHDIDAHACYAIAYATIRTDRDSNADGSCSPIPNADADRHSRTANTNFYIKSINPTHPR